MHEESFHLAVFDCRKAWPNSVGVCSLSLPWSATCAAVLMIYHKNGTRFFKSIEFDFSFCFLFSARLLLLFIIENCFYMLISQALRYLRDPSVQHRDKQRMKQELASELVWMAKHTFLIICHLSLYRKSIFQHKLTAGIVGSSTLAIS